MMKIKTGLTIYKIVEARSHLRDNLKSSKKWAEKVSFDIAWLNWEALSLWLSTQNVKLQKSGNFK